MKITSKIKSAVNGSHHSNIVTTISRFLGVLFIIFIINSSIAFAATGFDLAFGTEGKVISSPDGSQLTAGSDMALQADGKIVMVGARQTNSTNFIVARYNSNGSLDTTFGTNGFVSTTFGTDSASAVSVAIQPDGKIVVGGGVYSVVNNVVNSDLAVTRYNSDGSLDTTFDGDGKATVSFNPEVITTVFESLASIKIAPDGKIVLGGRLSFFPQTGKFALARLNADGSLDTSFGTNGRVVGNQNIFTDLNTITVLADGAIIAVGTGAFATRIAQKYSANGILEWGYGGSDGENNRGGLNGVAVQSDGKIILTGVRQFRIFVVRLNADGTVDNSFNLPASLNYSDAYSVAIQPDGKIVTNTYVGGDTFSLIRFNTNGSLDSSFGIGGILTTNISAGTDTGKKVIIQPDGKILTGGSSSFGDPERYYFTMARIRDNVVVPSKTAFDYDGDGKSDVSVYRPSNGGWYLNQSTNGFLGVQFGLSGDKIVPADYDGDGKTDIAIYRNGDWWILNSGNNSVKAVQFGLAEDKPQSGDFDGDGKDDLVVYRPSTGVWYVLRSSDNNFTAIQWGISSDIPQSADYDGDGRADFAVFRPSNGVWYIYRSLGGNLFVQFGANGDKPIAADYDGDGRTDFAVWRAPTRQWFILKSSNNQADIKEFGTPTDIPVPADYDGDGKADPAVFRPSNGTWYQQMSTQGAASQNFGLDGDRPTPSAFIP